MEAVRSFDVASRSLAIRRDISGIIARMTKPAWLRVRCPKSVERRWQRPSQPRGRSSSAERRWEGAPSGVWVGRVRRRSRMTGCCSPTPWQTWQRPTLPRLETEYHRRWGVSRPSSEWDRVQPPRYNHQVGEGVVRKSEVGRSDVGSSSDCPKFRLPISDFRLLVFLSARLSRCALLNESVQADRAISTGKLNTLQCLHTRPINVVVFHGSQGVLVSRWVSRLDAFSGYPVRT